MPKQSETKDNGKSIRDKSGVNEKTDSATLNDLTNNDGSEDPGAELDTISLKNKKLKKDHTPPQAEETLNPGLNSENDI